jgi:hypothetical protein
MPDSKLEILTTVAEDPLLAVEGIFTATLTGRLRACEHTLEPTGKMCSVKFLGLYQFSDELICVAQRLRGSTRNALSARSIAHHLIV